MVETASQHKKLCLNLPPNLAPRLFFRLFFFKKGQSIPRKLFKRCKIKPTTTERKKERMATIKNNSRIRGRHLQTMPMRSPNHSTVVKRKIFERGKRSPFDSYAKIQHNNNFGISQRRGFILVGDGTLQVLPIRHEMKYSNTQSFSNYDRGRHVAIAQRCRLAVTIAATPQNALAAKWQQNIRHRIL